MSTETYGYVMCSYNRSRRSCKATLTYRAATPTVTTTNTYRRDSGQENGGELHVCYVSLYSTKAAKEKAFLEAHLEFELPILKLDIPEENIQTQLKS